jgi:hypothetical protein
MTTQIRIGRKTQSYGRDCRCGCEPKCEPKEARIVRCRELGIAGTPRSERTFLFFSIFIHPQDERDRKVVEGVPTRGLAGLLRTEIHTSGNATLQDSERLTPNSVGSSRNRSSRAKLQERQATGTHPRRAVIPRASFAASPRAGPAPFLPGAAGAASPLSALRLRSDWRHELVNRPSLETDVPPCGHRRVGCCACP